ncbi:MAG: polysaccharide biosynthesis/export family protein [Chlamydiota bacterium]
MSVVTAASQNEPEPAAPESVKDVATLTKVSVHPDKESISVEITCSRPITPTPQMISDPSRLVLDFADTISASPENHINVNQDGLKSVRIGVQPVDPPTTRVVLDLEQERPYQLLADGNTLRVKLGQQETAAPTGGEAVSKPNASADSSPTAKKAAGEENLPLAPAPLPPTNAAPVAAETAPPVTSSASGQASSPQVAAQQTAAAPQTEKSDPHPTAPNPTPSGTDTGSVAGQSGKATTPAAQSSGKTPATAHSAAPQGDPKPALVAPAAEAKTVAAAGDPPPASASTAAPLSLSAAKVAPDVSSAPAAKPPAAAPLPGDYVIGEQDVLSIVVWKERELSATVVVRPDGKITLPLINEIKVVGMTPEHLQEVLTEKFKPFLNVPQVTVEVTQINSRKAYLIGEVMKTGTFPLNSSTTVLQIIAQAGGLRDFAKRKDIYILRTQGGKQQRYRFNYDDVIKGKNTQQNIVLQPGDMVVVP